METKIMYDVIRADGKARFKRAKVLASNLSRRNAWKLSMDYLEIGEPTEVVNSPPKKKSRADGR